MIRMDRKKMSKSKGNLITPARYFETVGADALRLFHLFIGPPGDDMDWTEQAEEIMEGCGKFLDRLWRLSVESGAEDPSSEGDPSASDLAMTRATHRLIAKVSEDLERWSFNTAVAACMEFVNELQRYRRDGDPGPHRGTYDSAVDALLLVLAPMAPHMTAEAWERRHGPGALLHAENWPSYDADLVRLEKVTMVVQVDGKVRDRVEVSSDIDEENAIAIALASPRVKSELNGSEPARVVARPPRLVNVVR